MAGARVRPLRSSPRWSCSLPEYSLSERPSTPSRRPASQVRWRPQVGARPRRRAPAPIRPQWRRRPRRGRQRPRSTPPVVDACGLTAQPYAVRPGCRAHRPPRGRPRATAGAASWPRTRAAEPSWWDPPPGRSRRWTPPPREERLLRGPRRTAYRPGLWSLHRCRRLGRPGGRRPPRGRHVDAVRGPWRGTRRRRRRSAARCPAGVVAGRSPAPTPLRRARPVERRLPVSISCATMPRA